MAEKEVKSVRIRRTDEKIQGRFTGDFDVCVKLFDVSLVGDNKYEGRFLTKNTEESLVVEFNRKETADGIYKDFTHDQILNYCIQKYSQFITDLRKKGENPQDYYKIIQDPWTTKVPIERLYGFDPYYLNNNTVILISWFEDGSLSNPPRQGRFVSGGRRWSMDYMDGHSGTPQIVTFYAGTTGISRERSEALNADSTATISRSSLIKKVEIFGNTGDLFQGEDIVIKRSESSSSVLNYGFASKKDIFKTGFYEGEYNGDMLDLHIIDEIIIMWRNKVKNYDGLALCGDAWKMEPSMIKVPYISPLDPQVIEEPPVTTTLSEPVPVDLPLKVGSKGDSVKKVQAKVGVNPDGDFGAGVTEPAVKTWQKNNGLVDNGIVDKQTWEKMFTISTTTGSTGPVEPVPADLPLKVGSKGESVKKVQAKIGVNPDGDFGAGVTEPAVKAWQKQNSLTETGIIDKENWEKMFGTTPISSTPPPTDLPLKVGSKGESVKKVQTKLGILSNGDFDSNTETSVKTWQKANGLPDTGVIDKQDWEKMFGSTSITPTGSNAKLKLTVKFPDNFEVKAREDVPLFKVYVGDVPVVETEGIDGFIFNEDEMTGLDSEYVEAEFDGEAESPYYQEDPAPGSVDEPGPSLVNDTSNVKSNDSNNGPFVELPKGKSSYSHNKTQGYNLVDSKWYGDILVSALAHIDHPTFDISGTDKGAKGCASWVSMVFYRAFGLSILDGKPVKAIPTDINDFGHRGTAILGKSFGKNPELWERIPWKEGKPGDVINTEKPSEKVSGHVGIVLDQKDKDGTYAVASNSSAGFGNKSDPMGCGKINYSIKKWGSSVVTRNPSGSFCWRYKGPKLKPGQNTF